MLQVTLMSISSLLAVFDVLAFAIPVPPSEAALDRALSPLRPRRPLCVWRARVEVAKQHHGRRTVTSHWGLKIFKTNYNSNVHRLRQRRESMVNE